MKANVDRVRNYPLYLLMLAALLLTACGGTPSPSPAPTPAESGVRPLTDILVSGPAFTDVQPRSVTVLLDTSIPVVCAAVYGTTTDYGQLATDTDMAGTGHQNHRPILTGLQPDTEYHIRLQGVGPDGTLYRSQDYTFRTPAEEVAGPQRPSGENLALLSRGTRVVGVSSNYGGGDNDSAYGAHNAIDGDPGTQWSSDGDGDAAWIEIELPKETHVTRVGFWTRTMGSSAEIFAFRVVTDRGESYGPFKLPNAAGIHYFETDFTARRLRFEAVETSGGNTGAVEIEVYGEPAK